MVVFGITRGFKDGTLLHMRTPGRCTNTEGCWISASHRNVWLSVGEDFVCPNCNSMLSPPLPQTRSLRMVKRAAAYGAAASIGLAVIGAGAVELSRVSWPGQSVAAQVVRAPGVLLASTLHKDSAVQAKLARVQEHEKQLTAAGEGAAALDVVNARPNSAVSMVLASTYNPNKNTPHAKVASNPAHGALPPAGPPASGPLVWLTTAGDHAAAGAATAASPNGAFDEKVADAAQSLASTGPATQLSQTVLAPGASMERPVVLPISFGAPVGPETDAEPVNMSWHHHGVVAVRASHFLPAAPVAAQASPDAIAQICRIPSLMH